MNIIKEYKKFFRKKNDFKRVRSFFENNISSKK